jgi:SAM-dependent methyltransferase
MRLDVLKLREFYASALGAAAHKMVSAKLAEAWGDVSGLDILGLGYATPYLTKKRQVARRAIAAMPAAQGVEVWPGGGRTLSCLTHEAGLPFANALFDRVLLIHALEESEDAEALLREVWRVLAPSGRVIIVAANRRGPWANAEATPFGQGRPYTIAQLERLARDAELEPTAWSRALYAPPWRWTSRWAEGFELTGSWIWPMLSGVILLEAVKQTFAVRPKARPARVRVFSPGALNPQPAGGLPSPAEPAASANSDREMAG